MRNPLRKTVVEDNTMADQQVTSVFHQMLNDLIVAHDRMEHMAQLAASLTLSAERGSDFIKKIKTDLLSALEQHGSPVIDANIEQQIAEFIPKNVKAE